MQAFVFVFSALLVLGGAFGVILGKNPVRCALSLVLTLFGVAILFISLEANFLAAVQVIVYAGAIVVLFLPFWLMRVLCKTRDVLAVWPGLLVCGITFGGIQF